MVGILLFLMRTFSIVKKILSFALASTVAAVVWFSLSEIGFAQDQNSEPECDTTFCGGGLTEGAELVREALGEDTGIVTEGTLIQGILFWVRVFLLLTGTLAFVAFVYAGFLFVTSFANEENNEKAKKIMTYTGIGIIVILLSYALTNFFVRAAV